MSEEDEKETNHACLAPSLTGALGSMPEATFSGNYVDRTAIRTGFEPAR
jgi:hypothetical protein